MYNLFAFNMCILHRPQLETTFSWILLLVVFLEQVVSKCLLITFTDCSSLSFFSCSRCDVLPPGFYSSDDTAGFSSADDRFACPALQQPHICVIILFMICLPGPPQWPCISWQAYMVCCDWTTVAVNHIITNSSPHIDWFRNIKSPHVCCLRIACFVWR